MNFYKSNIELKDDVIGLNGYTGFEMADMFINCGHSIPNNIYFSEDLEAIN